MANELLLGAASDRGPRPANQDAFLTLRRRGLFAVADGVGGLAGGGLASRLAVGALREHAESAPRSMSARDQLEHGFRAARETVTRYARGELRHMSTTLVVARFLGPAVLVAHLGDSRAYRFRDGCLTQLTRDHTLAHRWRRVSNGEIPVPAGVANTLTRAISRDLDAEPEVTTLEVAPGDAIVLTTDGVHGALATEQMERCLALAPERAAPLLVREALDSGGTDNATAVVIARP